MYAVEPFLRGHPAKRPTPMERPIVNLHLDKRVLITTPNERQPPYKATF